MGIAQTTGVETGGRGRGCREAQKSGRVADGLAHTAKIARNWEWQWPSFAGEQANLQERGGPGLLTVGCGFRTCMHPARQQKKPTRSARLRSRVIVVGPNSAELVGGMFYSGIALLVVARFPVATKPRSISLKHTLTKWSRGWTGRVSFNYRLTQVCLG